MKTKSVKTETRQWLNVFAPIKTDKYRLLNVSVLVTANFFETLLPQRLAQSVISWILHPSNVYLEVAVVLGRLPKSVWSRATNH